MRIVKNSALMKPVLLIAHHSIDHDPIEFERRLSILDPKKKWNIQNIVLTNSGDQRITWANSEVERIQIRVLEAAQVVTYGPWPANVVAEIRGDFINLPSLSKEMPSVDENDVAYELMERYNEWHRRTR
jgi:hypothetical protein